MKVIREDGLPIKMWLDDIEDSALDQARNLARLPFAFSHIALMPDAHLGYGMPIGGVMATRGVVSPNCVGVDIGCGMLACRTSLDHLDLKDIKTIMGEIRRAIPVGFNHRQKPVPVSAMPKCTLHEDTIVMRQFQAARSQLGTLGGGNHFIEIQQGSDGHVWLMIHSGSRNLGFKVAKHYNDKAKELNARWFSSVDTKWDLAFLPFTEELAQWYMAEMNYCVRFALANREMMMREIMVIVAVVSGSVVFNDPINIAHNYAQMENHFGHNVVVHRKGATSARKGELGIIPGSQGTPSYIVRGLGNPQSFSSCSHGAGRTMGRKQAKRELDLAEQQALLEGVVHSVRSVGDLDEAPGAYKDIAVVMENQKDLVEIVTELTPLGVVKG